MSDYYIAEWKPGASWAEEYDLLRGPDGFECCLTEPEDRTWHRDGSVVVEELNRLLSELEKCRAEVKRLNEILKER